MRAVAAAVVLAALSACAGRVAIAPVPSLPFALDSARAERVSDGVVKRYLYSSAGPWAIHVLDVDLGACNAAVAVKDADSAAARIKTSVMLADLGRTATVLGGVNGDFFSLANGTPTGLLVVGGRVFTPPVAQGVLAIDSAGVAHIARFSLSGGALRPFHPRDAVGGRQVLARDSVMVPGLDSAGGVAFGGARHPRTAAGVSGDGRRLVLVVVDGRQKPYSDGMTLRELATLMLALGTRTSLNLDGGGSSTMLVSDGSHPGTLQIANHPSDKEGERPVGDAVAIVKACRRK